MKKDIEFPENKNLHIAIAQDGELWEVVLINNGQEHLRNILVASTGYGLNEQGEKIQTSTLRHFFEELSSEQFLIVEKIDPAIFHLTNEYWVSYWIQDRLYDRCFLFVPESINTNNLVEISILGRKAVLHA